jgi:hypothetical protein
MINAELTSNEKNLTQELEKMIFTRDKSLDSLWYYLEDLFGEIIVALHLSRVEMPLEITDKILSEWLGILDIVLNTQLDYMKLLNLGKVVPISPSTFSGKKKEEIVVELMAFSSSFDVVKRYCLRITNFLRYHKHIKRPDFCDSLIVKDFVRFSDLLGDLIELFSSISGGIRFHIITKINRMPSRSS